MYLNVYVPRLQYEGGVASFFTFHRGATFASSALMGSLRFVRCKQMRATTAGHAVKLAMNTLWARHLLGFFSSTSTSAALELFVAFERAVSPTKQVLRAMSPSPPEVSIVYSLLPRVLSVAASSLQNSHSEPCAVWAQRLLNACACPSLEAESDVSRAALPPNRAPGAGYFAAVGC